MTSYESVPQRESLGAVEARYYDGTDKATLQTLVKAFKGIQKLPPDDPNSFFRISGFHGLPFRGPGATDKENWWGGYCHHGDVLFPSWHRAYVLRLENALRSVPGCEILRLPYWDELVGYEKPEPEPLSRRRTRIPKPHVHPQTIPTILTSPEFEGEPNPLYSYKLQESFQYNVKGGNERYSKPIDYETKRYPLSGLVGRKGDEDATTIHNNFYSDQAKNVSILNENVAHWLQGGVRIPSDDTDEPTPLPIDVTSVYERVLKAIKAPNYTVFSNTRSQDHYNSNKPQKLAVSLESPHNSIHLAVGGFYQKGETNANHIRGANGDMGCNETAAFDPIFYFHHCFVDYVFWKWQLRHDSTTELVIDEQWEGTKTRVGLPVPDGAPRERRALTPLTLETPLYPFLKDDGKTYFTTNDLIDIRKAGYDYGPGRLDALIAQMPPSSLPPQLISFGFSPHEVPIVHEISGINTADYSGSYVVRLYGYVKDKNGESVKVELGREAVLSRLKSGDCLNCQSNLERRFYIPLHKELIDLNVLEKDENGNYRTSVGVHTLQGEVFPEDLPDIPNPVVTPF